MMNKKKRYFKDDWWMELNISDGLKSHIMKNQLSYLHSPWTTKCDGWWKSRDRWQNLRNGWIINYIKLLDLFLKKLQYNHLYISLECTALKEPKWFMFWFPICVWMHWSVTIFISVFYLFFHSIPIWITY